MRVWMLYREVWATADQGGDEAATGGGGGGQVTNPAPSVIEAFQGVEYPITSQGLINFAAAKGVTDVQWGQRVLGLRELFMQFPNMAFLSREDVETVIAKAEEKMS